jgi:cell division protease FtsH
MEKRQKFSIWYVILGVWFVLLLQNSITTMFAVKTIPYSEFLKLLKENKVIEVAITADQIQGKLKDGAGGKEQMFRTVRVDPDTSKLLEKFEVNFKGEIESRFLPTLLSWVVPVFLFFGLWYFLMKRMAGQQPGFMSLGNRANLPKSAAKFLKAFYWWVPRGPAKPCWPKPLPVKAACRFSV